MKSVKEKINLFPLVMREMTETKSKISKAVFEQAAGMMNVYATWGAAFREIEDIGGAIKDETKVVKNPRREN
jgi:hypothetical protein